MIAVNQAMRKITSVMKSAASPSLRRRALVAAGTAHATHDGMSDLIYVLLPLWQTQFALSYATAGAMRGIYAGVMAAFQIQASRVAQSVGAKQILVAGTAISGLAYLIAGQSGAIAGLYVALMLGGLGASTQHPLASSMVARANEGDQAASRAALTNYNFAGDVGKMLIPAGVGIALTWFTWQQCASATGLLGIGIAALLAWIVPNLTRSPHEPELAAQTADSACQITMPHKALGYRFKALLLTAVIDSATRMGFLTFLPFLLRDKGATTATIGVALTLLFVGGAIGKLACGYLGQRLGMVRTVWFTEAATAILIISVIAMPLHLALVTLPLLGLVLNGTSSVLYGSVPEVVDERQRERAFAVFYTGTIGAGAVAPLVFGWIGDQISIPNAMQFVSAFVCLTLPLIWFAAKDSRK